jgi:hypothetical protein
MSSELVIAIYRAKPGKEEELAAIIEGHVPMLREQGLITGREPILMRSMKDGTFLEIFEWNSSGAARQAHENPAVGKTWAAMMSICDMLTLADLEEATQRFPHFVPI